jgi:hypothetical protein
LEALFNVWLLASPRSPPALTSCVRRRLAARRRHTQALRRLVEARETLPVPAMHWCRQSTLGRVKVEEKKESQSQDRTRRDTQKDPRVGSSPPSWQLGVDVLPWPWSALFRSLKLLSRRFPRRTPPLLLRPPSTTTNPTTRRNSRHLGWLLVRPSRLLELHSFQPTQN